MDEISALISALEETDEEMDKVKLRHCDRCHSAIKSDTVEYLEDEPVIKYKNPNRCNVCKSENYQGAMVIQSLLPDESEGVLCKCKFPGCEKEFFNLASWFKRQQDLEKDGNPWMPYLIDQDPERLKRIEDLLETANK